MGSKPTGLEKNSTFPCISRAGIKIGDYLKV